MSHTRTSDDFLEHDPDLRESLRVIRRQHWLRIIGVVLALMAAVATAVAYASLSYSDRNQSTPAHRR